MAKKRSKFAKVMIYIALAAVVIGVIAPFIMYFGVEYFDWNKCDEWYVRNEETRECEEISNEETNNTVENFDNEESCAQAWWTWYEENQICILPDAE